MKAKGQAAKSKGGHRLPITDAMRRILDEAVALRDMEFTTLRATAAEREALADWAEVSAVGGDIIFPNPDTGEAMHQPSQIARPALEWMKSRGLLQLRARQYEDEDGNEWTNERAIKLHDLRATFATFTGLAGVDELTGARLMGHASKTGVAMTSKYKAKSKLQERLQAAMQATTDAILQAAGVTSTALRTRSKLRVVA